MEDNQIIKLEAELDLTKTPCEIRVKEIESIWMDFGYWLEVGGFMVRNVAKYKEQPIDEVVMYAADYLKMAAEDYKIMPKIFPPR